MSERAFSEEEFDFLSEEFFRRFDNRRKGNDTSISGFRERRMQMKEAEEQARRLKSIIEELKNSSGDVNILSETDLELLNDAGIKLDDLIDKNGDIVKTLNKIKAVNDSLDKSIAKNDSIARIEAATGVIENAVNQIKSMRSNIDSIIGPWEKADHAASQYVKTLGATKKGMDALRKSSINNVVKGKIGIEFNMSTDELLAAQQKYVQGVGRSLSVSNESQRTLAAMHAVMNGRENELAVAFENFGVNLEATGKHAGKMFDEASRTGLSFEKYSDNVAKNIKIAQNYTFKNGLKGLEGMAKKATALRLDMGQIASLADKISSVEGSIDVASKLQVLGGPFASFSDPLGMLSEGLLDVESLTDRVANMIGGLGNFDKSTGEVRVSAFNKQRVKAAAAAMGMDYGQLMESVNAQAKRKEIEAQINSTASARGLSSEMQELIKNSATFNEEGKAGVSIDGEFKTLDQLSNNDYETLVKETQNESADIKDIAKNVRSLTDIRSGKNKQKDAVKAQMTGWIGLGNSMKRITNALGRQNWLLRIIAAIEIAGASSGIVRKFRNVFGERGSGVGRMVKGAANKIRGFFGGGKVATVTGGGAGGGGLFSRLFGKGASGAANGIGKAGTSAVPKNILANPTNELKVIEELKTGKTTITGISSGAKATKTAAEGAKAAKFGFKGAAKVGSKTAGKIGAKAAEKIGSKMLAGVVKGGIAGIVGAAGNIATDMLVDNGKIKKGGIGHTALKVGSSALEGAGMGAAIGSIIPVIGTAVGTAVGAVTGAVVGIIKMKKIRREQALDNKLAEKGIERKGEYGARKLKLINHGLDSGKISNRMRRRLEREGDMALLAEIDKKRKEKEEEKEARKDRKAARKAMARGKGGDVDKNISRANINVKNAYFGGNAFGDASLIGKTLGKKVEFIKGKPETGKNSDVEIMKTQAQLNTFDENRKKIIDSKQSIDKEKEASNLNQIGGKLELVLGGSVKLTAGNGLEADLAKYLIKDDNFIKEITSLVDEELFKRIKGNNNGANSRTSVSKI